MEGVVRLLHLQQKVQQMLFAHLGISRQGCLNERMCVNSSVSQSKQASYNIDRMRIENCDVK